jgi:hypothetical protein
VITADGSGSQISDDVCVRQNRPANSKEKHMFTHPDFLGTQVRQHTNDLIRQAEQARILTLAIQSRRAVRAAARRARHHQVATALRPTRTAQPAA